MKLLDNCKSTTESYYLWANGKVEINWEQSNCKLEEHPKMVKPKLP